MVEKKEKIPTHIAIIMDGNGRWAKKHALGRISGHKKGAEAVRVVTRTCREMGIKFLTLYAFSVENWSRPASEVNALMDLLVRYLSSEEKEMNETGIRLNIIGDISGLTDSVRRRIAKVTASTKNNDEMVLTLALNYGSRNELIAAVTNILDDVQQGEITRDTITMDSFRRYLYTADMPDPDLLIRTSGEYRLSNFLLWQCAYTEFYFTDVLWPDFGREDILKAISEFQRRERRYGRTSDQIKEGTIS
ncbi:MAG: isoprenyl transferase [Syntrophaceae bacterium]|nr:isoprenyl transferase [Syntrophaceae bacterium]